jgi:hypothetical protein
MNILARYLADSYLKLHRRVHFIKDVISFLRSKKRFNLLTEDETIALLALISQLNEEEMEKYISKLNTVFVTNKFTKNDTKQALLVHKLLWKVLNEDERVSLSLLDSLLDKMKKETERTSDEKDLETTSTPISATPS